MSQEQESTKDPMDQMYEFSETEKHRLINQFTTFLYQLRKNNIKVSGPTLQEIIDFGEYLEYIGINLKN